MRGRTITGPSWRAVGLGLVVAAAPVAAAGESAATGVRLAWDAPAGACPDRPALLRRMHRLLGDRPLALQAQARVSDSGAQTDRFRLALRLRWNGGSLQRDLVADDCEVLAQATVVLVAVLAAPLAASERLVMAPIVEAPPVAPEAEPPASTEPPALVPEVAATGEALAPTTSEALAPATGEARAPTTREVVEPAAREPTPASVEPAPGEALAPATPRPPARVRRLGPVARVSALAGVGAFPRGDFGLAVAAGWMFSRVRLEAGALVLPGQGLALGDGSGRGGTIRMAAGLLRACPRFLGGALELAVCGAVEAGGSWTTSVGLVPERRAGGPWLGFALGGALDGWFSPQVGVHVAVDGFAAPVATAYTLGGAPLAPAGRFGARASVGLTIALGPQKIGRPEKKGR